MLSGKAARRSERLDNIHTKDGWDSEAYGLFMHLHLQEPRFLQLLQFFSELMPEVGILYNVLQKQEIDVAGINQVMDTL